MLSNLIKVYTRRAKPLIFALLLFSMAGPLRARIVHPWTYKEMFDKADLVVIASVVSTTDTSEAITLHDLEPAVCVVGVVTQFKSHLVLKGPHNIAEFNLHHYRLASEADLLMANGPALVTISPDHPQFLLFLIREQDGRFAPVTGQTDPRLFSVIPISGDAD